MKLTKDTITKLALPVGKKEAEKFDDDIPGFGVRLRPHSTQWIFRYRRGRRQRRMTIGNVTAITAAQARTIASKLYARVKLGEDPAGDRTETLARANDTFALALKPYLARKQTELRPRSYENLRRHLETHAAPLHKLELTKAAERRTLAALLTKIASDSGPVEANSMKGSLSGFFTWVIGQGLLDGTGIEVDPTTTIPSAPTNGARSHVPTDAEIVKIWGALRDDDYGDIVRLLTLSLCRLSEIGGMRWDEVDDAGVFHIPAARTKMNVARDVSLPDAARAILARRKAQWDGERAFVFGTGEGGFQGWAKAKAALDARAGVTGWVHHDLRRYGSTTLNAEGIALPHVVDMCLGHAVVRHVTELGQVLPAQRAERHYNWAAYSEQVRIALALWGERVMELVSGERKPAKVLALRRRKGA